MEQQAMSPPATGPYLQLAAFCESVLTEQNGVNSLIRVVDRITVPIHLLPEGAPHPPYQLIAAIAIKAGSARGSTEVTLRREAPSGLRETTSFSLTVLLEGEDRGIQINLPIAIDTREEGLYWFDVLVGGNLMTRMPLRVIHQEANLRQTVQPQ
jgi:hypothetical protein